MEVSSCNICVIAAVVQVCVVTVVVQESVVVAVELGATIVRKVDVVPLVTAVGCVDAVVEQVFNHQ